MYKMFVNMFLRIYVVFNAPYYVYTQIIIYLYNFCNSLRINYLYDVIVFICIKSIFFIKNYDLSSIRKGYTQTEDDNITHYTLRDNML